MKNPNTLSLRLVKRIVGMNIADSSKRIGSRDLDDLGDQADVSAVTSVSSGTLVTLTATVNAGGAEVITGQGRL